MFDATKNWRKGKNEEEEKEQLLKVVGETFDEVGAEADRSRDRPWRFTTTLTIEVVLFVMWFPLYWFARTRTATVWGVVAVGGGAQLLVWVLAVGERHGWFDTFPEWINTGFWMGVSLCGMVGFIALDTLVRMDLTTQTVLFSSELVAFLGFVAATHRTTLDYGSNLESVVVHAMGVMSFGVAGVGSQMGWVAVSVVGAFALLWLAVDVLAVRVPHTTSKTSIRCDSSPYATASRRRRAFIFLSFFAMTVGLVAQQFAGWVPRTWTLSFALMVGSIVFAVCFVYASAEMMKARTKAAAWKRHHDPGIPILFRGHFCWLYYQIVVAMWVWAETIGRGSREWVFAAVFYVVFSLLFCVAHFASVVRSVDTITSLTQSIPVAALGVVVFVQPPTPPSPGIAAAALLLALMIQTLAYVYFVMHGTHRLARLVSTVHVWFIALESLVFLGTFVSAASTTNPGTPFQVGGLIVGVFVGGESLGQLISVCEAATGVLAKKCCGGGGGGMLGRLRGGQPQKD